MKAPKPDENPSGMQEKQGGDDEINRYKPMPELNPYIRYLVMEHIPPKTLLTL
ncbi:MAG: hypothetical protein QXL96_05865 [Ignisphaera sp.]